MSHEIVALIVTILGASIGATWVIASKLASIELALGVHAVEHKSLLRRVVVLEQGRSR